MRPTKRLHSAQFGAKIDSANLDQLRQHCADNRISQADWLDQQICSIGKTICVDGDAYRKLHQFAEDKGITVEWIINTLVTDHCTSS